MAGIISDNLGRSSGLIKAAGGGLVLQVVQTVKTDTFSSTSTTFVDVTGLTVAITPASSSNKVLVMYTIDISEAIGDGNVTLQLYRGTTAIFQGDAASNRQRGSNQTGPSGTEHSVQNFSGMYLDSPSSTSELTYKFQLHVKNTSATFRVGGDTGYNDDANRSTTPSQITVMEISG